MRRAAVALLIALALLAATPSPKPALPTSSSVPSPLPSAAVSQVGVWTIRASELDSNIKSGDFSTPTQVVLTREGGDITADRANGNFDRKFMTLYGHVIIHDTEGNFGGLSSTKPTKSSGPSTLTADQVHIDGVGKVYTATGNVHYVQANTTVDANTGVLNDLTHDLDLKGNVHIVQGARNMVADHVLYNTVTGQSHAEGDVTMQFPSEVNTHVATPRPIHVPNPLQRHKGGSPAPTASPHS